MNDVVGDWSNLSLASQSLVILAGGVAAAILTSLFFRNIVGRFTRRTRTDLDDRMADVLRTPVAMTFLIAGAWLAAHNLRQPEPWPFAYRGVFLTLGLLVWTVGAVRVADTLVTWAVVYPRGSRVVNSRTRPVFELGSRIFFYGAGMYFVFLAWKVDLTAWAASAGIVGIALGFAAQDSLSNLFAGVVIVADAPYKLGDFIILDAGTRGRVTEIGIRATRLLTQDDVQIIVPNAKMANATIVNETGGPYEKARLRVKVGVAYGSDIDRVRAVLLAVVPGTDDVAREPAPRVRFLAFGDSSLDLDLQVWIDRPEVRDAVLDALNTKIYKALRREGIEIPYPKRDVYLHAADPIPFAHAGTDA